MAFVLEDADIVEDFLEADESAVTRARRVCSECGREVLGIGVIEAPEIHELVGHHAFWTGCVFSGPIELPSWWFCARGGKPEKAPGEGDGLFGVTGSYRLYVKRIVTRA